MSDRHTPTTEEVREAFARMPARDGGTRISETGEELFDRWLAEVIREAKNDAWHEGFSAGWDECDDPSGFVNDKWDAKTPSPYRKGESND